MAAKWTPDNGDDLIQRYVTGASVLQISRETGISRPRLTRFLNAHVIMRSASEQERLKWDAMPAEQRARQVNGAHEATRGLKRSIEDLSRRAASRAETKVMTSPLERGLYELLLQRGVEVIPQKAIGPYNCDLAADPIAVEVFGGEWHFTGRHLARAPQRIGYLANAGWHTLMVVHRKWAPISGVVADQIVALRQEARCNPAAHRQYWVIQGDGKLLAAGRADDRDLSIKPPTRMPRDGRARFDQGLAG